jgi:uncharacterized protein (DUF983 family)
MSKSPHNDERDLSSALRHGARGHCPACGNAPLFGGFLKPIGQCASCGQNWTLHSADDMPAYLVVLVVGHILVPFVVAANRSFDLSTGLQMALWPALALILAVMLIQPAKGAVIAFQWARRMHGFSGRR